MNAMLILVALIAFNWIFDLLSPNTHWLNRGVFIGLVFAFGSFMSGNYK